MTTNRRILIIDDERPILLTLEALLGRHGYTTETAATAAAGVRALQNKPASLVLLDLQLPDAEGLEMLDKIKSEHAETPVIILTAHDSLSNAIESIKRGAYHFISKPYAPEELLSLIEKALEKQTLLRETTELREKTHELEKRLEIAETRFHPEHVDLNYSRYRRVGDMSMDESFFPVAWTRHGYRTPWLAEL